jgi:hypothetical protein
MLPHCAEWHNALKQASTMLATEERKMIFNTSNAMLSWLKIAAKKKVALVASVNTSGHLCFQYIVDKVDGAGTAFTVTDSVSNQRDNLTINAADLLQNIEFFADMGGVHCIESAVDDNTVWLLNRKHRSVLQNAKMSEMAAFQSDNVADKVLSVTYDQMKSAYDAVQNAVAKKDLRYYMQKILFEPKACGVRVAGTNGHVLATYTFDAECLQSVNVSSEAIKDALDISKSNKAPIAIYKGNKWLMVVETENYRVEWNGDLCNYPNVDGVINQDDSTSVDIEINVASMIEGLKKIKPFICKSDPAIRMQCDTMLTLIPVTQKEKVANVIYQNNGHIADFNYGVNYNYILGVFQAMKKAKVAKVRNVKGMFRIDCGNNAHYIIAGTIL